MPLTIAHAAAVMPLRKTRLPLSALVMGSLAPDMEYFLHLAPRSDFSHTIPGLFTFCLPAGLFALWIFHRIWKEPMVALLDRQHHHHAKPFPFGSLPRFLMIVLALLIGSVTHLLWDSFTHDYGWTVQHMSALQQRVHLLPSLEVPLYLVLQYASTFLGCGVLLFTAFYHRQWTFPAFFHNWPLLFIIAWLTGAGGIALGLLVAGDVSNVEGLKRWVGSGVVVACSVTILVTTFLCAVQHLLERFR